MTLIINVLHKDFSVIAADRLVNANGPTTVTIGNVTVNLPDGGKIVGAYPKIVTSADGRAAVGAAGTIAEHTFIEALRRAGTPLEALTAVRAAAQDAFAFEDRGRLLDGTPQMINEAIPSFLTRKRARSGPSSLSTRVLNRTNSHRRVRRT